MPQSIQRALPSVSLSSPRTKIIDVIMSRYHLHYASNIFEISLMGERTMSSRMHNALRILTPARTITQSEIV
jgi:hypothetical protein